MSNFKPYQTGLDVIANLRPVWYYYIDDDTKTLQIGLIAQEVELVFPNAIKYKQQLHIDYIPIICALINSVKELRHEIEILKANSATVG